MVYNFPEALHYGWGESKKIGKYVKELGGSKALFVTDEIIEKIGLLDRFITSIEQQEIPFTIYNGVKPNPTDKNVEDGLNIFKETGSDIIVAIGGGSPMDAAKGILLMANHPGNLEDYYAGAENRLPVTSNVPLFIAVPTTSGTGSEVSRGAIITNTSENRKRAIGSHYLLPKLVILDPELTVTMPPKLTAHTGLDALSHSLEAFGVDRYAPIADAFAREGIRLVSKSLVTAYEDGRDKNARADMMIASTLGAMAFLKGLGVVHSLAHQLSPQTGIPHGAACGIILPHAIHFNLGEGPAIQNVEAKYAEVANMLGVDTKSMTIKEAAHKAADVIQDLLNTLNVPPRLREWGVTDEDIEIMSKNAMLDHCHPRNPRPCTETRMMSIFKSAL